MSPTFVGIPNGPRFTELESMSEQMSRTIESLDDVNVRLRFTGNCIGSDVSRLRQEAKAYEMLLDKFEKMQKTVDDRRCLPPRCFNWCLWRPCSCGSPAIPTMPEF